MTCFWNTAEFASVIAKMSPFEQKMFDYMWENELKSCAEFMSDIADEMDVSKMEWKMADHIFGSLYDMVLDILMAMDTPESDISERFMMDVFMSLGGDSDHFIW